MEVKRTDYSAKVIECIQDIPPLPDVVVQVMRMTRKPETTAKELTQVISKDQGLTGNVLRLCNSAYYGLPRAVSSLNQAIMYLGFHTVRNLVLTCSIQNFYNPKAKIYGYTKGGLWNHVLATARVSDMICERIRPDLRDTAYTAGLLHDIGQLIIGNQIGDSADTIIQLMVEDGVSELDSEREVVGFTHCELGAGVADKWNFPMELVHALRYHHKPSEGDKDIPLTHVVHLADTIVLEIGFGIELDQIKYPTSRVSKKKMGIDTEFLVYIRNKAETLVSEELNLISDDNYE